MSDMGILAFLALLLEAAGTSKTPQSGPPGPPATAPAHPVPSPAPAAHPAATTPAAPAPSAAPGLPATPAPAPAPAVPPGGSVPMPPWPAAPTPGTLPPFPGPGWIPDTPVTAAISARASYWNPQLWDYSTKKIRKPFVQEVFGGQWLTFRAAWHPGDKGPQTFMATEAWRLATAPQAAPSVPTTATTNVQAAASAMNAALSAHGYKQADQGLYKAFQGAAGLTADGYPGQHTMTALANTLHAMGQTIAPVKVYPWATKPGLTGYDGKNAPTLAEWQGAAAPVPSPAPSPATAPSSAPPAAPSSGPPPLVGPEPAPGAWQNNKGYITAYQAALTFLSHAQGQPAWDPQGVDGGYGPHTASAVKAFQTAHNLKADGEVGNDTSAAIDAALNAYIQAAA